MSNSNASTALWRINPSQEVSSTGTRNRSDDAQILRARRAVPTVIQDITMTQDDVRRVLQSSTALLMRSNREEDQNSPAVNVLQQVQIRRPAAETLIALQEWEGYVIEIREKEKNFTARLLDITAGSPYEEEEADIPFAEISQDDAENMRLGSVFRWVIGYRHLLSGSKERVSRIVFRDLPAVTRTDLQKGAEWADSVLQSFES